MHPQDHWEKLYRSKQSSKLSWYQPNPELSMRLIEEVCPRHSSVIDVGGGTSLLVDHLLDARFARIAVLDISSEALRQSQERLGERSKDVRWLVADVTATDTLGSFDVWHDRAVFHFLTVAEDRRKYVESATNTVPSGGHIIIGTFALEGPSVCSGLEVRRYDAASLGSEFGSAFRIVREERDTHITPSGKPQQFIFAVLARVPRA